jgi:damage-control phosphatase, subfamily I
MGNGIRGNSGHFSGFLSKKIMRTFHECLPCFVKQAVSTLKRAGATEDQFRIAMRTVFCELAGIDFGATPPVTARKIYRIIRRTSTVSDPFSAEKIRFNDFALSLLPEIQKKIGSAPEMFMSKLKLAIAGNIIDFGKNGNLCEQDVLECFNRALETPIDETAAHRFFTAILDAEKILFLCDNAGEIVFDKLFIEEMPYKKITCAVRGKPVINDATMEDAQQTGLTDLVTVISNGSDVPGTLLDDCSDEFKNAFENAELVIAKGQGNFETLNEITNKRIFFLLQVKCPVIARDIGFPVGSFVIKENRMDNSAELSVKIPASKMEETYG